MLRKVFGPGRDEVTWGRRGLHNEELYALYTSLNIVGVIRSRRMRWVGHVTRMRYRRGTYRVLVAKLEGRRILRRTTNRWEDNIKMVFQEMEWGDGLDYLAQGRNRWRAFVYAVVSLWFTEKCREFLEYLKTC